MEEFTERPDESGEEMGECDGERGQTNEESFATDKQLE